MRHNNNARGLPSPVSWYRASIPPPADVAVCSEPRHPFSPRIGDKRCEMNKVPWWRLSPAEKRELKARIEEVLAAVDGTLGDLRDATTTTTGERVALVGRAGRLPDASSLVVSQTTDEE